MAMNSEITAAYAIHPENYRKFIKAHQFWTKIAEDYGGFVEVEQSEPPELNAVITVRTSGVDVYKKDIEEFRTLLQIMDSFEVFQEEEDVLLITITINNVWMENK